MVSATRSTCARRKIDPQAKTPRNRPRRLMKRFLPYLRHLRGRRLALVFALLFGALSGLVYGFGLPTVMNEVFPKIFTNASGGEDQLPLGKSHPIPSLGARETSAAPAVSEA